MLFRSRKTVHLLTFNRYFCKDDSYKLYTKSNDKFVEGMILQSALPQCAGFVNFCGAGQGLFFSVLGKLGPGQLGPRPLGPRQLGPGAKLSGAQLSALKKWQIGPNLPRTELVTVLRGELI